MNNIGRNAVLILLGLCVCLWAGCRKDSGPAVPASAAAEAAKKLPGADQVLAALEKKDYEGAMAALLKVKQTVANEEQNLQFMTVYGQMKDKLVEAAPTDPKAAETLAVLRGMMMGR